jgi:hypothetical protein
MLHGKIFYFKSAADIRQLLEVLPSMDGNHEMTLDILIAVLS